MKNLKSQKGVTLVSLIVYIIVMTIVIGIISVITKYFYANLNKINNDIDISKEYTKLNSYLSEDVNNSNNVIYACNENSIVFFDSKNVKENDEESGYRQYTFKDGSIYFNKIKICTGIKDCKFEVDTNESDKKFTLEITFNNNQEEIKKVSYAIRKE